MTSNPDSGHVVNSTCSRLMSQLHNDFPHFNQSNLDAWLASESNQDLVERVKASRDSVRIHLEAFSFTKTSHTGISWRWSKRSTTVFEENGMVINRISWIAYMLSEGVFLNFHRQTQASFRTKTRLRKEGYHMDDIASVTWLIQMLTNTRTPPTNSSISPQRGSQRLSESILFKIPQDGPISKPYLKTHWLQHDNDARNAQSRNDHHPSCLTPFKSRQIEDKLFSRLLHIIQSIVSQLFHHQSDDTIYSWFKLKLKGKRFRQHAA